MSQSCIYKKKSTVNTLAFMESIKGCLTVLIVAAALCTSCSSRCIDQYPEAIGNCSRYYREVEKALLANETNKYQLREKYFPSSGISPVYGHVKYCNAGHALNEWYYEWSSSILFAYTSPGSIRSIMLELIILLLPNTPIKYDYFGTSKSILELQLSLNLTTTGIEYDAPIMDSVLEDLTSRLKVYASTQKNQESWNQQDYQYLGYSTDRQDSIFLLFIQILVLVFTLNLFGKFTPTLYQKTADNTPQWVSFYWASCLVTGLCNIAVIICELRQLTMDDITIKLPVLGLFLLFDLFLAFLIKKLPALQPPRIIRWVFCICYPCCYCSETCHLSLIQTMAMWNILAFVHFTTWSIVPIILYAFVFPLQTLSVLALCATTIFCTIALTALLIGKSSMLSSWNSCKANSQIIFPAIMILTFLALVILTAALYLRFITGLQVNSISGFIASFFPSAVLTVIGWFVTKGKLFNQLQTHTPPGRQPEMAEGVRSSNTDSQNPETLSQTVSETTPLIN